jgi:hypothetical protein
MNDSQEVQCPYCWELVELEVDSSAGSQVYTEDCAVCCHPMRVAVEVDGEGGLRVEVAREND